jgi:hypothetical protein
MIFSYGIMAPFKYPVFVFSAGALLLSTLPFNSWSIDSWLKKRTQNK